MIVVVLGVVFVLVLVWLATAYASMRNDADIASRRFVAMSKRTQALAKAVEIMNANMDASFDSTDADVAANAKRTMSVLGDAIKREAKVVEASLGRNSKAIAALSALLDANTKSLSDLMTKIGTEDKQTLATIMAKMEARHAEIVSYLSGGGMDAVADALATAAVGTEAFTVEHFSSFNMRVALSRFGVTLDDDQLKKLDADVKKDVATGLTLREAMFKRLSKIQPVTKAVKEKAVTEKAAKEQAALEPVYEAIRVSDQSHRDAIVKAMADQYAMVQQSLSGLTTQIAASKAAAAAKAAAAPVVAQAAIAQTIAKVDDVKTALAAVASPVTAPVQLAQGMRYLSFQALSVNNGGPQTQLTQASFNDASGKVVPAKMSIVSGNIMGTGFTSADQCFASLQNLDSVTHCNVDPIANATLVYDLGSPDVLATVRSFYLGGSDDKNRFPSEIEVRGSAMADMSSSSLIYRGIPMTPWSNNNTRLKAFDFFKLMQFKNKDAAGTSVTSVDFRDGQSELANGDWFGIRWDGVLWPKVSGTYTFQMSSDDGGSVMINRALVVANGGSGTVAMTAGKHYQIFMNFTENTGEAKMRVEWKGGDQAEFTTDFTKLLGP
jgi:PA14 domain